ncbi:MAG: prepilin-type N-terminal cleavage/methylation domain-containing protein [Legionellales bacterium]|nr:prepilin-type N-terminal cleavage/methylation domain-containing protein [Legionellales bacterium]
MLFFKQKRYGFTLIEILFVIVIAGIIAAIVIPRLTTTSTTAKETANIQNINIINKQVERWNVEKGSFPETDLSDIGNDPDYFPDGIPVNPIDGSSYALDPESFRVIVDAEEEEPIIPQ